MNILYGIEPDLCISNPDILVKATKDVLLPKYFYSQISHLKQGNFQLATEAAQQIINSLKKQENSDIIIFNTVGGATVYFHNESEFLDSEQIVPPGFDMRNLLDRYLLSFLKVAELLKSEVIFIASSSEVIRKCLTLKFELISVEEFLINGNSWLHPQMILDILVKLDPMASIQWQEDIEDAVKEQDSIRWIDITFR